MANISTGGGTRARKDLNIDVPLVPFLDLLLCCVMFLLVTAVWNELGVLNASQLTAGPTMDVPINLPRIQVTLRIAVDGYVLSSTAGDQQELSGHDPHALQKLLRARRVVDAAEQPLTITAEDGVPYADLVAAMDVVRSSGYTSLQVNGGPD